MRCVSGRFFVFAAVFSQARAKAPNIPILQARVGTMQGLFFTDQPVTDYASAKLCDTDRFAKFFHAILKRGVYFAPSQFETGFLSIAHTGIEIEKRSRPLKKILNKKIAS